MYVDGMRARTKKTKENSERAWKGYGEGWLLEGEAMQEKIADWVMKWAGFGENKGGLRAQKMGRLKKKVIFWREVAAAL